MFANLAMLWAVCPSCKEGLEGADRWATGFNTSIMFMMAMPFAVVTVIGVAAYRARQRQDREDDAGATPPS